MPKDSDTQTSTGAARAVTYRSRLFVALLLLIGASIVVAAFVVSRGGGESVPQSSTERLAESGTTTTATTIPTRTEVASRLRSILEVRDRA
jgi:hypothetical protein